MLYVEILPGSLGITKPVCDKGITTAGFEGKTLDILDSQFLFHFSGNPSDGFQVLSGFFAPSADEKILFGAELANPP